MCKDISKKKNGALSLKQLSPQTVLSVVQNVLTVDQFIWQDRSGLKCVSNNPLKENQWSSCKNKQLRNDMW